ERIGLRYPAVIVDRTGPVAAFRSIDLIDRDDLARLWLGQQIVVVEAPPCRRIAAESAALERDITAATRYHIENPHLEHVTRFGVTHKDGAGADMNAEPLAGAAPMDRAIHRSGTAPVDILGVFCPKKDTLRARIALDHPRVIVVGVVGQRFDCDEVP